MRSRRSVQQRSQRFCRATPAYHARFEPFPVAEAALARAGACFLMPAATFIAAMIKISCKLKPRVVMYHICASPQTYVLAYCNSHAKRTDGQHHDHPGKSRANRNRASYSRLYNCGSLRPFFHLSPSAGRRSAVARAVARADAPVSRQTIRRVWHTPRRHSRPATLLRLRSALCPVPAVFVRIRGQ